MRNAKLGQHNARAHSFTFPSIERQNRLNCGHLCQSLVRYEKRAHTRERVRVRERSRVNNYCWIESPSRAQDCIGWLGLIRKCLIALPRHKGFDATKAYLLSAVTHTHIQQPEERGRVADASNFQKRKLKTSLAFDSWCCDSCNMRCNTPTPQHNS